MQLETKRDDLLFSKLFQRNESNSPWPIMDTKIYSSFKVFRDLFVKASKIYIYIVVYSSRWIYSGLEMIEKDARRCVKIPKKYNTFLELLNVDSM